MTRGSIILRKKSFAKKMDCRVEPGNDENLCRDMKRHPGGAYGMRRLDGVTLSHVMPGLVPGIHVLLAFVGTKDVDCRGKPGNDGSDVYRTNSRIALSRPSRVSGYIRPPIS
jgi:hypothetical protein